MPFFFSRSTRSRLATKILSIMRPAKASCRKSCSLSDSRGSGGIACPPIPLRLRSALHDAVNMKNANSINKNKTANTGNPLAALILRGSNPSVSPKNRFGSIAAIIAALISINIPHPQPVISKAFRPQKCLLITSTSNAIHPASMGENSQPKNRTFCTAGAHSASPLSIRLSGMRRSDGTKVESKSPIG